jgi:uncharacterized integral membrane protein
MKPIYTIIVVIFVMFVVTFALQNTTTVQLRYYDYFCRPLSIYMLIFLSFIVGVIFTGFMGIVERFRLNRTINRLNKTIRDLRRDLKELESSPDAGQEGKTIRTSGDETY